MPSPFTFISSPRFFPFLPLTSPSLAFPTFPSLFFLFRPLLSTCPSLPFPTFRCPSLPFPVHLHSPTWNKLFDYTPLAVFQSTRQNCVFPQFKKSSLPLAEQLFPPDCAANDRAPLFLPAEISVSNGVKFSFRAYFLRVAFFSSRVTVFWKYTYQAPQCHSHAIEFCVQQNFRLLFMQRICSVSTAAAVNASVSIPLFDA